MKVLIELDELVRFYLQKHNCLMGEGRIILQVEKNSPPEVKVIFWVEEDFSKKLVRTMVEQGIDATEEEIDSGF